MKLNDLIAPLRKKQEFLKLLNKLLLSPVALFDFFLS